MKYVNKMKENRSLVSDSLKEISKENIIAFFESKGLSKVVMSQFSLKSRSEKINLDILVDFNSLTIYSSREDIYINFEYSKIDEIFLSDVGFAIIYEGSMIFRCHL